jgi:hypothetical protein
VRVEECVLKQDRQGTGLCIGGGSVEEKKCRRINIGKSKGRPMGRGWCRGGMRS